MRMFEIGRHGGFVFRLAICDSTESSFLSLVYPRVRSGSNFILISWILMSFFLTHVVRNVPLPALSPCASLEPAGTAPVSSVLCERLAMWSAAHPLPAVRHPKACVSKGANKGSHGTLQKPTGLQIVDLHASNVDVYWERSKIEHRWQS